jgi:hypothetical protein
MLIVENQLPQIKTYNLFILHDKIVFFCLETCPIFSNPVANDGFFFVWVSIKKETLTYLVYAKFGLVCHNQQLCKIVISKNDYEEEKL